MKTIKNKQTELRDNNGTLDRISFLKFILNEPTREGLTLMQIRDRMRIIDAIEKANGGDLTLEDADFIKLKSIYESYHFKVVNKEIAEIADHLDEVLKQK